MLYIPDFDGFVKGAGDDLIAPMMGPVYTVDLEAVSFELGYRKRAFLTRGVSEHEGVFGNYYA